jgi:chromosome segregation ATPase
MKPSATIRKQMEDLAEVAALLADRPQLQSQIDRRIATLSRTLAVLEANDAREEEAEQRRAKMRDETSDLGKRIKAATDDIGKDDNEKQSIRKVIESMSDTCEDGKCDQCALCKYEYLKTKEGVTKRQIKLVLGLE